MNQTISLVVRQLLLFTLVNVLLPFISAQEPDDGKQQWPFVFGVNAGVHASITGELSGFSLGTEAGTVCTWKQERKKTVNAFEASFVLSCRYDFRDLWTISAGIQAGLAQAGFAGVGAGYSFAEHAWYLFGTLAIPFSESNFIEQRLHCLLLVSYYMPIQSIIDPAQGLPSDSAFRPLSIGVLVRLARFAKRKA